MIDPKNILIIRTDRIGDVVLSLPLAGLIKKHYPQSRITFLTKEYTKDLVTGHRNIDNSIQLSEINNRPLLWKNVKEIKKNKFDSCIMVYPTFKIALIIFLAGIKYRIGTGYRWYSFLFNQKFYEHRKYAEYHELEYNVHLLKLFNIEEFPTKASIKFDLPVNKSNEQKVDKVLNEFQFNKNLPTIIFHPGSGGSAIDLPLSKMKELVGFTVKNIRANVIITGTESERKICKEISDNNNVINLAGQFNLGELIVLINKAGLLISNSTGPIHIAAALDKYVIGFYPKIKVCSPERWGPYSEKSFIFQPEIECNNCTREQCERLNCMNSIDILKVFEKIKSVSNII
jgi:heptosyltransferase III